MKKLHLLIFHLFFQLSGFANEHVDPWSNHDLCYNFMVEWHDPYAALMRRYKFLFYPKDNSIEMYDTKLHRRFLTRTKFPSVHLDDLFLGSILSICSRQLKIVDYGDLYTKKNLGAKNERTFAIIKPGTVKHLGDILNTLRDNGLEPQRVKMVLLTRKNASDFYHLHKCQPYFMELVLHMSSGPIIAMELRGINAISKWRELLGPIDSAVAREKDPNLLRAKYGENDIKNGLHGADSVEAVSRELEFFFPTKGEFRLEPTTKYDNCTCCVIKPHAVRAGFAGDIIKAIQKEEFEITDIRYQIVEKANATEFYNLYKGVLMEYPAMVDELSSGVSVALALYSNEPLTTDRFRDLCGPADPEVARHVRPTSLRAVYGNDKIENAVHCTDLEEDGNVEVEYFFRILSTPI